MRWNSQAYLWRTTKTGQRQVSWRLWVLIWVTPVLFALASAGLLGEAAYKLLATEETEGRIVRVYAWDGETIFDRGTTHYGPVFRYVWSDGNPTEASVGMSHRDWNFDIGSRHQIRYFPGRKTNVVIPGPHNWAVLLMIGAITLMTAVPAWWATRRIRRWRATAV